MKKHRSVIVVGAGAFGLGAALALARRGFVVNVLDPGPIPHPAASSTDTSKVVRMDYGSDGFYADLAASALDGWRTWNREWPVPRFHETGLLMLSSQGLDRGGFEAESYAMLRGRGVPVERLDRSGLASRFPRWESSVYAGGYFNPHAGWAESGEVVAQLAAMAREAGIPLHEQGVVEQLVTQGSRVGGVRLAGGETFSADLTLVSAGAWTPTLAPGLAGLAWATGQPVLYFRPREPGAYRDERFPVWCADIANTGWYGFPVTPAGELKVGHHGRGRPWCPGEPLEVSAEEEQRTTEFVRATFRGMERATAVRRRLCLYCDTFDGDFLVDHHPDHPGLVVAAGGSGHGFKFAPVLGEIIADVVERVPNPWAHRFAWRSPERQTSEQARHGLPR